ncbi:MAG: phage tail protein [Rhodospirillaceae bacterium]|nr:phage tail protein [Rhodospirillaceae bacterium]
MTMQLNVRMEVEAVRKMLKESQRKILPKVVGYALNETARTVQKIGIKLIADDIGIKQKLVRQQLKIRRATWRNLSGSVEANGRRLPVSALKARAGFGGVTYQGKGGGRRKVPGGFMATMSNGHTGAFKRQFKNRLPIYELHGPSIPHVFVQRRMDKAMRETAQHRWPVVFQRELKYRLNQAGYGR